MDSLSSSTVNENTSTRHWSSWGISTCFHIAILIALILLGFSTKVDTGSPEVRRVDLVLTQINDQNETEYLTESEVESESETATEPLSSSAPVETLEKLEEVNSSNLPSIKVPQLDATGFTELESSNSSKNKSVNLSQAERDMIAADRARFAAEAAQGSETSIEVFGSGELTGRKFIFVLDRSKSMGSQGLGVLDKAASQVSAAVNNLKSNHKFQVIAYHHRTTPMSERNLLRANDKNKASVEGFIRGLAAFGSTRHDSALIVALSMRPDVIVLLTDGGLPELNQGQLATIRRAAGSTQIHCIQFGAGPRQTSGTFMEALAAQNDGSYRYIDVNKWNE